jgi:hypothetical protein
MDALLFVAESNSVRQHRQDYADISVTFTLLGQGFSLDVGIIAKSG